MKSYSRVGYEKLFKGVFMEKKMELKDKFKAQAGLMFMYIVISFFNCMGLLDVDEPFNWEAECKKIVIIMVTVFLTTCLFTIINRLDNRKAFSCLVGIECIIFSLVMLYEVLRRYYKLKQRLGYEIIYIYSAVAVILFLLHRNFYKKLPSEKEPERNKKKEPERGLSYAVAASVIGVAGHLTVQQHYVVNMIISLMFSCGWLALGWFMFQAKKKYLDDSTSDVE